MTAPLVPADVDLRDFSWMPIEINLLRRSKAWLICKRKPELAFYMLNLWTASWHDRPASSLEDDDDMLADLAMCDASKWPKVREQVLRGWVSADDGRLYHPVVAAKALEAWLEKLASRLSSGAGNAKRWHTAFDPAPIQTQIAEARRLLADLDPQSPALSKRRTSGIVKITEGDPDGSPGGIPDGSSVGNDARSQETGQGQGQGQGEGISEAKASAAAGASASVDKSTKTEDPPVDKRVMWETAKTLLMATKIAETTAREFVGSLVSDFGIAIVDKAVHAAVQAKPVDPKAYLTATCKALKSAPSGSQYETAEETRKRLDADSTRPVLSPEEVAELRRQREAKKAEGAAA